MKHVALALSALLATGYIGRCLAEQSSQESFRSPEEASEALFTAVRNQNEAALTRILGAGSELLTSGDAALDKADREQFTRKYQEMHRLAREIHGERLLYVGAENWPFPVPLIEVKGVWQFDADAGRAEIRFREVGADELTAIALCHTLLAAARSEKAEAADGLTAEVLAAAKRNAPVAFHGYYFRSLRASPGGPGFVAYPAAHGTSGVMTFVIRGDDSVRQKDLGADSMRIADALTAAQVDSTWTPAEPAAGGLNP